MGKFKYSMQNILDIKIKLETQAKNEFSEANRAYLTEKEKLEELFKKRAVYEAALKEQLSGSLNISEINICKKNINSLKSAIRTQLMNVKKAEDMLEVKRVALNELMKERKTHEKLRDKKFEDFQKEEKDNESKEIDQLVSFTYNSLSGGNMAELNEAESTKDTKKTKKEKKMEEKAAKKAAKKAKKNHEADKPDAENDDSDSVSSKIVMVLVTILIIAIWLGIFAVFVKADVGGFGSTVLAPALKDVPVLSKILPDSGNITASESKETAGYTNLDDAVSRIKELEKQLDDANSKNQADAQTINDLNAQIQDLSTYKEDQAAFEEEKEKYYEEVVFSDKAPDIKEYKKFYEQVDPANAEILYKQVCEQLEQDDEIKDYAQTYSKMKPKEAAAIFDSMTDNLSLVAKILNAMDAQSRGNILGKMDSATAAKVTKIMNPSQN